MVWRLELFTVGTNLQDIVTTSQLARLLKVSEQMLLDHAFGLPDAQKYDLIAMPKRNGQTRVIHVPSLRLKMIQRRLLPFLELLYQPSSRAHAYIKGKGLRSNAAPHIGKRYVLNTDLVDFFGSINFGRIRGRLMAAPYHLSDAVATTISRIATYNGSLPMGAPTSPILSNIICSGLDSALARLAKNHGCFYTRYADDLTFSSIRRRFPRALAELEQDGEKTVTVIGQELALAITQQGFQVNLGKTRLLGSSDRQEVCGIVCNQKLNTLPKLRRQIRAALHAWRKFGLEKAEKEWDEKYNFRRASSFEISLRGKIEFLKHIRGVSDSLVIKYAKQFNDLRTSTQPITFEEGSDWKHDLARTSACISCIMNVGEDFVQGSGFVIEGGYIVTNHHVVSKGSKLYDQIEVTFPGSILIPIEVEVVARLPLQDLALLRVKDELWRTEISKTYCDVSYTDVKRDDVVWLTGWPNYNSGDEIHLVQGVVNAYSYPDGVKLFRITPSGLIETDDSVFGIPLVCGVCDDGACERASRLRLQDRTPSGSKRLSQRAVLLKSMFGGRGSFC